MGHGYTPVHVLIDTEFNNHIGDFRLLQIFVKAVRNLDFGVEARGFVEADDLVHAVASDHAISIAFLGQLGHVSKQGLSLGFAIGGSDKLEVLNIGDNKVEGVVRIIVQ